MKRCSNQTGFTLVELIVVIAILGVLAVIAVPSYIGFVENAKIKADLVAVGTLNRATPIFRMNTPSSDPFLNPDNSPNTLMQALVTGGYLDSAVVPKSKDAAFIWSFDEEKWHLSVGGSVYVLLLSDGLSITSGLLGSWQGGETYSGSSMDIVIPVSLNGAPITNIGQNTFRSVGLEAVAFEEGSQIKRIHARAFFDNNLTELNLPDTVERIDLWAFRNNELTEIKLPASLEIIELRAFDGNDLTKIAIGEHVDEIQDRAFGKNTDSFKQAYETGGAGTYVLAGENWVKQG